MERVHICPLDPEPEAAFRRQFGDEATDALLVYPRTALQRMSARLALSTALGRRFELAAHPDGRPYLIGSQLHVSISHTQTHVAAMVGRSVAGIDVQTVRPKLMAMLDRYLDEEEQHMALNGGLDAATALWCAKEAVYKAAAMAGLPFRDGIVIRGDVWSADGVGAQLRHAGEVRSYRLSALRLTDAVASYIITGPKQEVTVV